VRSFSLFLPLLSLFALLPFFQKPDDNKKKLIKWQNRYARAMLERAAALHFAPAQYKLGHAFEFAVPARCVFRVFSSKKKKRERETRRPPR
jgi:hypothetical protein